MTSETKATPLLIQQPPSFLPMANEASPGLSDDCFARIREATWFLLRTVFQPAQTFQEFADSISDPFDALPDDDAFSTPITQEQFEALLQEQMGSWQTPPSASESKIEELDKNGDPTNTLEGTSEPGTPLSEKATKAMAIVATLSPFIASNWDPELPPLQKSIMDVLSIAYLQFSCMDEADLQGSSPEELAWIAASKFTASLAGIPSEYCPTFPWEEEGSTQAEQEPKTSLAIPVQSQASTESAWPHLAGRVIKAAFLCGSALLVYNFVGGLGGVAAAAAAATAGGSTGLDFSGNLSLAFNSGNISFVPDAGASFTIDPVASQAAFNWTPLILASTALPGVYKAAKQLWNYEFRPAAFTIGKTALTTGVQWYMGSANPWTYALSLAAPPLVNFGRKIYDRTLSPRDLVSIDAVKVGVGMAALELPVESGLSYAAYPTLGLISYISEFGWIKTGIEQVKDLIPNWADPQACLRAFQTWSGPQVDAIKQSNPMVATLWDYVAGAIGNGAQIASESPYLTTAVLIIGALLLAQGVGIISAPQAVGSAPVKEIVLYEKKGSHTCKNGITYENIKVPGPKGLNAQQQEDLFNAFIQEMLEKSPLDTRPGDTIEFLMPNEKEWVAELKPAKENERFYAGHPNLLTKKIPLNEASRELKNYQLLHKLMVEGATATHVVESLRSIATEKIPFHIASVNPVGFKNGTPLLCGGLKFLLSNPKMLEKMKTSGHPELRRIANEYERLRHLEDNDELIDLTELEKAIRPNAIRRLRGWPVNLDDGKIHDVIDYETVILHLMKESGDTFEGVFEKKIIIPNGTDPTAGFRAAHYAYPRLDLYLGAPPNNNLQELLSSSQTDGTNEILFEHKPEFLRIHLEVALAPNTEPEVPLTLNLDWNYIQPTARSNNLSAPEYHLHSFTSSANGALITYEATVESIMGRDQMMYWKVAQEGGSAKRMNIEKTEFENAAKMASDFVYSAKLPILAVRHNDQYTPQLTQIDFTPPAVPPNPARNYEIALEHGNMVQQSMFHDAAERGAGFLNVAVQEALRDADKAQESTVILPIPMNEVGPDGAKGPIGIMWFAVQDYIRNNPDTGITNVKFQIPREAPKQDELVKQLHEAEKLSRGMFDSFPIFEHRWKHHLGSYWRLLGI